MLKHYKKSSPRVPIYLSNGAPLTFEFISVNVGVFATEDAGVQSQIQTLQARGVGGVIDITPGEYEELKKKAMPSRRVFREELSAKSLKARVAAPAAAPVPVANQPAQTAPIPTDKPPTKPKSVRRK